MSDQSALDTLRRLDRTTSPVSIRAAQVFVCYYDREWDGVFTEDIKFVTEDLDTARFLAIPGNSGLDPNEGCLKVQNVEGFILQFVNLSGINFVLLSSNGLYFLNLKITENEMETAKNKILRESALKKLTIQEREVLGLCGGPSHI